MSNIHPTGAKTLKDYGTYLLVCKCTVKLHEDNNDCFSCNIIDNSIAVNTSMADDV